MNLRDGTQKGWILRVTHPSGQRTLWVRLSSQSSANGFRRVTEIVALHAAKQPSREVLRTALRQSYPLSDTGPCRLNEQGTFGELQSMGQNMAWNLRFETQRLPHFNPIPGLMRNLGLTPTLVDTTETSRHISGTVSVNGEREDWTGGWMSLTQLSGPRFHDFSVVGHCNHFVDPQGQKADFAFAGFTGRPRLWGVRSPVSMTSLYFHYQGTSHSLVSFSDRLGRVKSKAFASGSGDWEFQAEHGELSFRGLYKSEVKDFVSASFEDTDGSLYFMSISPLADLRVTVYRRGKLEITLSSEGAATLERTSTDKNPYAPIAL